MSVFTEKAKQRVQAVIDENIDKLRRLPNFAAAEPGIPLVDGSFQTHRPSSSLSHRNFRQITVLHGHEK